MKSLQTILILFTSLFFISLKAKEPSKMITVPLKIINTTFEKYPMYSKKKEIIEEVPVKTIFGTKMKKIVKFGLSDISGDTVFKGKSSSLFLAPIKIGGQDFKVVLDTGSVNLWVAKIGSNDKATIERHYDPAKSKSGSMTSEKFEITYGTGSTKGNYYTDFVSFISDAAYNVLFGAATETNFEVPGADGIMGLARTYTKYMYSPIWTLQTKGYIDSKSFSFKYYNDTRIEMYIGGEHEDFKDTNHTATCQLLHQSVYDNLCWTCKLYNIGFKKDDKVVASTSCGFNFLFDTGSNLMRLPKKIFDDVLNQLKGYGCEKSSDSNADYITCPKDANLDFYIEVGDHKLFLKYNEISDSINDSNQRKIRIQFMDVQVSLLGQPFFRIFHTKFDHENKVLKFYNNETDIKRMEYTTAKPNDDTATHFDPDDILVNWLNEKTIKIIVAVSICVAALFIVIIIVKCGRKKCCKKKNQIEKIHNDK